MIEFEEEIKIRISDKRKYKKIRRKRMNDRFNKPIPVSPKIYSMLTGDEIHNGLTGDVIYNGLTGDDENG